MKIRHINLWEAIFPHQLRLVFMRQIGGVVGIILLAGAAALGAALASWSPADPSLNHATALAPVNWLGGAGAIASDLTIQLFGVGAMVLPLVLAGWGWRLTTGQTISRTLARGLAGAISVLLLAGVAAYFDPPADWPLPVGLGGMFGELIFGAVVAPFVFTGLGVAGGAIGVGLLAAGAAGLGWFATTFKATRGPAWRASPDQADADEIAESPTDRAASVLIGGLLHSMLLSGALLRRLFRWLYRVATGRAGKEQQSRLKIAMARAEENAVVWSDEAEDDDEIDDGVGAINVSPRARESRITSARSRATEPWFGARLLRRLWGNEPTDFVTSDDSPRRVEPSFFDPLDEGDQAIEPDEFSETTDVEPLASGPMGAISATGDAGQQTRKARRKVRAKTPRKSNQPFNLPPLTLLNRPGANSIGARMSRDELAANAHQLESVLEDFGIRGEIVNVHPGPVVTLYELEPAPGIKSSRVIGLADDIARSMSAISARISVVPGRNVIGIELPNQTRAMVSFYDLISAKDYIESPQKLAISLGKNIGGEPVITDLARMPHLLVAGTTGSGKSVGINAMILSLLFRLTPDQCKLIMIDPKMLELSVYDGIPHLLSPVVTDPRKAVVALKWAVREMEDRYKNMSKLGVRNIDGYNARVREAADRGEVLSRTVQTGFDRETGKPVYETEELDLEPLPYIVVVVDEMADLMMVAGKDIEGAIQRLAQMARAAGLHLIMATQRPSVDVITGTIKANFPTRISFQVTSKIDSRTILGEQGAEQLLGQGDMLYMAGGGRVTRVHGAFVSDDEVESVVQFLKRQGIPEYLEAITEEPAGDEAGNLDQYSSGGVSEADQLYDRAVAVVARDRKASTSYIQRKLSIGYNRAATIIERMEGDGVISSANHAGKREVLVPEIEDVPV